MLDFIVILIAFGLLTACTSKPRERTMKEQMDFLRKANADAKKEFIRVYGYYPSA